MQEIIGFGGAFTEAAAHNFHKLSPTAQTDFLEAYFGTEGIGYTLGRIHINSCDFSLKSYNFDDVKDDFEVLIFIVDKPRLVAHIYLLYQLKHFDHKVTHDQQEIIPMIKAALATTAFPLQLLASPWSPPSWMKVPIDSADTETSTNYVTVTENGDNVKTMTGSSSPNGLIASSDVMSAWALYISYFIDAYAALDVPIWAVTPQNEPEFAASWEACVYNASFEREFIDGYLGPQLRSSHPEV